MYRILTVSLALAFTWPAVPDEPKDKFQYLEEVTGDKALTWVKERNADSTGELTKTPEFAALNERLLKILDSKERIPAISKHGKWFYNFWRDDKNKRGLWRRTTLDEYRKDKPNWETVLDLDELAAEEKENWVWGGANFLKPDVRAVPDLRLARRGRRQGRPRVRRRQEGVRQGRLHAARRPRAVVSWRDLDTLFVGTDFGPGSLTTSGYPRIVKEWKRGTPLAEAKLVFEGKPEDMRRRRVRDRTPGFEREFVVPAGHVLHGRDVRPPRTASSSRSTSPTTPSVSVHRDLLFVTLRTAWTVGGKTYPAGALLAADFDDFLSGERELRRRCSSRPSGSRSAGFTATQNKFILNELDNVGNRLYVLTREGRQVEARAAARGRRRSAASARRPVDADESDDYFLTGSRLPDAVDPVLRHPREGAAGEAQDRARRSSTPRGWRSASTRRRRRTGRRSRTSRWPRRT